VASIIKFDLNVTKVFPSAFHAVTCINTNIEVDIGQVEEEEISTSQHQQPKPEQGHKLGTAKTLTIMTSTTTSTTPPAPSTTISKIVFPQPPEDQKEGVCIIQFSTVEGMVNDALIYINPMSRICQPMLPLSLERMSEPVAWSLAFQQDASFR
jgi:hypothetical protein